VIVIWWTCPFCFDRMATATDPRTVERDRDAHLAGQHPGVSVNPALLHLSYWHTICDWTGTTA